MENKNICCTNHLHNLVLIWLGVLTGALIATIVFGYKMFEIAQNIKAAMLMAGF